MRLLVVMENYPLPMRTGGTIVGFNTLQQLSTRHVIDLICLQPAGDAPELGLTMGEVLRIQPAARSRLSHAARRALFWISPKFDFRGDRHFRSAISDRAKSRHYDAILMFELNAIRHCPEHLFPRIAVNIEDAQSLRIGRMARLPVWSSIKRLKLRIVAWLTLRYERAVLPRMGNVFLLSRKDIEDIREQGQYPRLAYVPYGVRRRASNEIVAYSARSKAIVYSGNMFHPPNVDGALFFLNEIFPLILKEEPLAVLWIVGADPDERIVLAAKAFQSSVQITGRVNDLAGYLASAVVSVCPVRLHIGVQTKVLESLSLGTPVVTTSAGNRGVGGTSGVHLHVEDDVNLFAARVCELFRGERWDVLSAQGRAFTEENFSWERSARELEMHLLATTGESA